MVAEAQRQWRNVRRRHALGAGGEDRRSSRWGSLQCRAGAPSKCQPTGADDADARPEAEARNCWMPSKIISRLYA
jgi:hypothetical protein